MECGQLILLITYVRNPAKIGEQDYPNMCGTDKNKTYTKVTWLGSISIRPGNYKTKSGQYVFAKRQHTIRWSNLSKKATRFRWIVDSVC